MQKALRNPLAAMAVLFLACLASAAQQQASDRDTEVARQPTPYQILVSSPAVNKSIFIVLAAGTESGGTGFLIDAPNGEAVVITNRHVCEVQSVNGKSFNLVQGKRTYHAELVAKSEHADLCILKPDEQAALLPKLKLSFGRLTPGDAVCTHGHPQLRPITEFSGHYLGQAWEQIQTEKPFKKETVVLIGCVDFMVLPGNSGSPLFNSKDEVAGVIFAYQENYSRCRGLFIPSSELIRFLLEVYDVH